jgi:hypothetical protein
MTFHKNMLVRQTVFAGAILSSLAVSPVSTGCPAYTKCPLDGAQSLKVDTEYEGIVAIGVFEHTTTTGQKHRFKERCK